MNECRNEQANLNLLREAMLNRLKILLGTYSGMTRWWQSHGLYLTYVVSLGPQGGEPFPNRMESPVVLLTYYSQSMSEAFPTPDLQIPVRSFVSLARWGTVAGFPRWDLFCIKQESTNKHNAQHRENAFNASCYDSGHYRAVIFSLRRHFSESKIAAIGGVFIRTLPFHPWRIIL